MSAAIQFIRGVDEEVVPDVRLTRSKDGSKGRAIFYFENPDLVQAGKLDVMGMYMLDEEGELTTLDVNAKFVNGKPHAIEASYAMNSEQEWERFIRFMNRYAESHGLGFSKA
jgi:photosystem II 13kDa protein